MPAKPRSISPPIERDIAGPLLHWYDAHARTLPWRAAPGTPPPDPYRVWLSEIMLQQTTVAAVKPKFDLFTTRWPDFAALARADEAEVMTAWAGLGYYARARNLIACAKAVVSGYDGRFPATERELRALPGIGDYTAAAIASIAFGERAVVVDANVERVVARLYAIAVPLPGGRSAIRSAADGITPERRAGDFAQAMMDLGSGICTVRAPKCLACPLHDRCDGFASGAPEDFPVKPAKVAKPQRHGTIFWAERDGAVLLVRRPPRGLLGGMRALPTGPWVEQAPMLADAPVDTAWRMLSHTVCHVFTHFRLELALAVGRVEGHSSIGANVGEWWPIADIESAGLPTVFAKAAVEIRRAT